MEDTKTIYDIDTPLMNQYREIKKDYKDAILFFRLGDFYEMFDDDAIIASKILGIVLTKRHDVPMCGVPHHSAVNYISKLIKSGYKVAICEQVSEEEDKKAKLFKRKVVRVITPGTIIEESLLSSKTTNYLACVAFDTVGWGMSWIDISTGEFYAINKLGSIDLSSFLSLFARIGPKEVITDKKTDEYFKNLGIKITHEIFDTKIIDIPSWAKETFWQNNPLATKSALAVIEYIKKLQMNISSKLIPSYFDDDKNLKLDETAIKTLEIIESNYPEGYSLFDILDNTKTSMGSRLLKKYLLNPLSDYYMIKKRLDEVNFLYKNEEILEKLRNILSDLADIERIYGRIVNLTITPQDCISLKEAIARFDEIKKLIEGDLYEHFGELKPIIENISEIKELARLIEISIDEKSSLKVGEGDLFKSGYNLEYDELKKLITDSQSFVREMEQRERDNTQIPSLKIGYNATFGYYIEITKTHLSKVPPHYIRKQTLVSAERFITEELKHLEEKILSSEEKIKKLESTLFSEIKQQILKKAELINKYANILAYLDVISSFAYTAIKNDYTMPEITTEDVLEIEEGRHPVVERFIEGKRFVPNDIRLDETTRTLIITGPNMSGKSVYLRQNALIVIMAHIGSFVPAKKARIGIVDRIMTRIGAFDRLTKGESTFMVEMKETSQILRLATKKSLILLDEVGRGTSTFDGISIAYAVLEYIHTKIKAKTLFATHFFEITELANRFNGIKNVNIAVKEWVNSNGITEIAFLHKVVDGVCDKSYGVHVAQLAGLPYECIHRAKKILEELESRMVEREKNDSFLPLFSSHPVVDKLKFIDTNKITPLEALNILSELKKEI